MSASDEMLELIAAPAINLAAVALVFFSSKKRKKQKSIPPKRFA